MIPLAHHPIRVSLAVGRRGRRPVRRLCRLTEPQPEVRTGTLDRLAARLPGQVSTPGDDGYAAATAILVETGRAHAGRRRPLPDAPRPPDTGDAPHFDPAGRAVRARPEGCVEIAAQYDVRFV